MILDKAINDKHRQDDLLHFKEACQGKTAQQMIEEARQLHDRVLQQSKDKNKGKGKEDTMVHVVKREKDVKLLEEAHSLLTKSLFYLFESTLPEGYFTEPRHTKAKAVQDKTSGVLTAYGVESMKDDGPFAVKLKFASAATTKSGKEEENVAHTNENGFPLFERAEYERLSIEAMHLRGKVLLLLGRPLQGLIDAEKALFFSQRLRMELGENNTLCKESCVFSVIESGETDLVAIYCAQRIRINGMLKVLRTITEAYCALECYPYASNFGLLHVYYREKAISLGKNIDEASINVNEIQMKLVEAVNELDVQKKKDPAYVKFIRKHKMDENEQLFEYSVPLEELRTMQDSTTCVRTFITDTSAEEEELDSSMELRNLIMKGSHFKKCRIENVESMGYGIVATKDINRGEKVCTDDVIASSNYNHSLLCDRCLRPLPSISRKDFKSKKTTSVLHQYASPCMHGYYCSKACESEAEALYHKPLCDMWPGMKSLYEWTMGGMTQYRKTHAFIPQLWALKRSAPANERLVRQIRRNGMSEFINFMYHSGGTGYSRMRQYVEMYREYVSRIPILGRDPMFDLNFTLSHQMMNIQYTFDTEGGCVLTLGASFFNHSCVPNVQRMANCFVAKRKIKCGEQLFCSYIQTNNNLENRNLALMQYGFLCACKRCLRERKTDKSDAWIAQQYKQSIK